MCVLFIVNFFRDHMQCLNQQENFLLFQEIHNLFTERKQFNKLLFNLSKNITPDFLFSKENVKVSIRNHLDQLYKEGLSQA